MTLQELYDGIGNNIKDNKNLADSEIYVEMSINLKHHIEKLQGVVFSDSSYVDRKDHKWVTVFQGEPVLVQPVK